ncbi:MAG: cytidylate kinase [Phycisphaerae bacterium]|nr:MAG: cytidylate kinase [Phycisphaerae bacterium]
MNVETRAGPSVSIIPGVRALRPVVVHAGVFRLDQPIIITIDGPAGTGKSSVARALAARLGLDFLDTGAMYRAAALVALRRGITPDDPARLVGAAIEADIRFDWSLDPPAVLAEGEVLDDELRTARVTGIVSRVAGIPALRRHMVERQREIAKKHPRLVTEGRDQGSVVFPDAPVKFYLDASAKVRASRRAAQLAAMGQHADVAKLLAEIEARDASDMSRRDGPLVRPDGAIVVDTSNLEFDGVVTELERIVRRKAEEP